MNSQQKNQNLAQTYNDIPYTSKVFAHCQPTRLYSLAKLKGLNPPPIETATILEIGCSFGGNLLPFAIKYPNSQLIGIDLSEHQINIGRKMEEQVGVDNLTLIAADISKVNFKFQFDYIICHGVFSWVPDFVQDAILDVVQKYLKTEGIAFISYNTYPGWHLQDIAKNLMLFGSDSHQDRLIRTEQSFETLNFTSEIISRKNTILSPVIKNVFDNIVDKSKYYIAHEYFENFNQPCYFKDFISRINSYGLTYVTDSSMPNIYHHLTFQNDEYQKVCNMFNNKVEDIEQYMDFIANRTFRTTLITHQENFIRNNRTNDIKEYELARNVNEIYLLAKATYNEATENTVAKWALSDISVNSDTISDLFFNKLSNALVPIRVQDMIDEVQRNYPERLDEFYHLLWNVIHLSSTYLSCYEDSITHYGEYPHIYEPYRNLIQFVKENPNVVSTPNIYFQNMEFNFLALFLAPYMDGTRTINDLLLVCRESIENQTIFWSRDNISLTNDELSDEDILKEINLILNDFYRHGYFNHYR